MRALTPREAIEIHTEKSQKKHRKGTEKAQKKLAVTASQGFFQLAENDSLRATHRRQSVHHTQQTACMPHTADSLYARHHRQPAYQTQRTACMPDTADSLHATHSGQPVHHTQQTACMPHTADSAQQTPQTAFVPHTIDSAQRTADSLLNDVPPTTSPLVTNIP